MVQGVRDFCRCCHRLIPHPLLQWGNCGSRRCSTGSCSKRMCSTDGQRQRDQRCEAVIGGRVEQHRQGLGRRRWGLCRPWSCGAMSHGSRGGPCFYPRSRSRLAAFAAAVQALQAQPWISWGSLQVLQPSPMSAQAAIRLCKSN